MSIRSTSALLREALRVKGWKPIQLARASGVARSTISEILSGHRRPGVQRDARFWETCRILARALGKPDAYFDPPRPLSGQTRGDTIYRARRHAGWSQARLADLLGVSRPTISRMETRGDAVDDARWIAAAEALGFNPETGDLL